MKQQKSVKSNSKSKNQMYSSEKFQEKNHKTLSLRKIKQNYSAMPNLQITLHHSKSGIISKLSKHLSDKLKMDYLANEAISAYEEAKLRKLSAIESQIMKINQENALKIDQLTKMEKEFIKKIQQEMKEDREKQDKLKKQYQKLLKEEQKIAITRGVRSLREKQDWVVIEKQQRKMQLMAKVLEKRHLIMGRDKSHQFKQLRKKEKQEANKSVGNQKSLKKQRKKKSADQLKQMGRQFLQHAKKFQAQNLKASTKLLDVYKKSIDYLPEMKTIIKSNAEDLSKPLQNEETIGKSKRKKGISKHK